MAYTRREFLGTATSVAALGTAACAGESTRAQTGDLGDDPLRVRRDFPVTSELIYLDSAYITPSPEQAVVAAQDFLQAKARNPISLGNMLDTTADVRRLFASLVNADESEVGTLFATSEGENIVAAALELGPGDNVVIDDLHYETTFVLYRHLEQTRGVELRIVRNRDGAATVESFADSIDQNTKLVSVAWVSHQNGYRHDLAGLATLAHDHGAYLYADAIQGAGMLNLDVKATDVDFFTTGTYKWLLGGYGVAPFFVRSSLLDMVRLDRMGSLHIEEELEGFRFKIYDDARKYGYATLGFDAVYHLRAALQYLQRIGIPNIERHTVSLANRLRDGLVDQGFDLRTPPNNQSAIVSFIHNREPGQVRAAFDRAGIKVSHREEGTEIRVGVALFNNQAEIDALLDVTASL